jgi:hypothetical protein
VSPGVHRSLSDCGSCTCAHCNKMRAGGVVFVHTLMRRASGDLHQLMYSPGWQSAPEVAPGDALSSLPVPRTVMVRSQMATEKTVSRRVGIAPLLNACGQRLALCAAPSKWHVAVRGPVWRPGFGDSIPCS